MISWKKYYDLVIKKKSKKKKLNNLVKNQIFLLNYFKTYLNKNEFTINFKNVQNQLKNTNKISSFLLTKKAYNFYKISQNYIKPFLNIISILKNLKTLFYQSCCYFLFKNSNMKQNFLIFYVIYFNFSPSNTTLQITNSLGNSKNFYSAGLVDLKGKQKVVRKLVLVKLFNLLTLLKLKLIKNTPVALHLKNVGSNKYLIVKKLKKKFFIKVIKTFELSAYNGCRKKKERRKRQKKLKK